MTVIRKPSALNQFYRDIKEKFNQKVLRRFKLPWMKSKELDIILEVISKLQPKVCFEWGSGFSTVYFPEVFPFIEKWYSVEHNPEWFKVISEKINDPRVDLVHIKRDQEADPNGTGHNDGSYADFKSYVEYPLTLNTLFDFIFIDGRARKACLQKAYDLITDKGIVIVHDANRDYYVRDMPPFTHVLRLTDYRKKRGGILLASKSRPMGEVLDIKAHQAAWKIHDIIAKILVMR